MTTSIASWEVGAGVTTNNASKSTADSALGRDQFLNLLIAQLKNQDPLNPMEGTEFTAQLAQFSSLEQLFSVNDNLESIEGVVGSQGVNDIIGLVGKIVSAGDRKLVVADGEVSPGAYSLDKEAAEVSVTIFDSDGVAVRRLSPGRQLAGAYSVEWDGRNDSGTRMEDGTYTYEVTAKDDNGSLVNTTTLITGEVTGITYEYATPHLMIGDRLVPASSVMEVRMPESAA